MFEEDVKIENEKNIVLQELHSVYGTEGTLGISLCFNRLDSIQS
jgi:hypothetical protein